MSAQNLRGKPLGLVSFCSRIRTGHRENFYRGSCIFRDAVEPKQGLARQTWCRAAMEPELAGPACAGRHSAGKRLSIMIPSWIDAADFGGWGKKNARMWGSSHQPSYDCGSLNNFAPPVEPSTASTRPTLRDGH
ncbi:protein of unknown function [Bradyrhizobium vignae]|uniref:Uncharacterized protein n=1 Tax=Bradyrhizobium vignae TaxID=1549949 RepID=A0A2U3Q5A4_9BRAD|nr:protein of unknown function [Bradyrhizobium vignae]